LSFNELGIFFESAPRSLYLRHPPGGVAVKTRLEDLYRREPEPEPTPPLARAHRVPPQPAMARLLKTLLDPVVLQRLLVVGGGLIVVGLLITLASQGIFDDPRVAATSLTFGSFAVVGAGWAVLRRTSHTLVGIALTFLGCTVLPLNLWFYHAQNLIRIDQHLWVGGVVCLAVYAATVFVLRRPVFLYAVQLGVLLTTILLLGQFDTWTHLNWIATVLTIAGAVTVHLPLLFGTEPDATFDRQRFGPPLTIGGHAQLAIGLMVLAAVQFFGYQLPVTASFRSAGLEWHDNAVWVSSLWLLAAAVYAVQTALHRQPQLVLPATVAAIAGVLPWLQLAGIDLPWQLTVVTSVGVVVTMISRVIRGGDGPLGDALQIMGLAIAVFCQAGLACRALMQIGLEEFLLVKLLPLAVGVGLMGLMWLFARKPGKIVAVLLALANLFVGTMIVTFYSDIPLVRKFEFVAVGLGIVAMAVGTVRQLREAGEPQPENTLSVWFGSLFVGMILLAAAIGARFGVPPTNAWDAPILLVAGMVMVVLGIVTQMKSTTIVGATSLGLYVTVLVGSLLHAADLAAGIYLGIGGLVIFVGAIGLSLARERLLRLPERMAKREGLFRFLNWR
jgi:hypothetical protein